MPNTHLLMDGGSTLANLGHSGGSTACWSHSLPNCAPEYVCNTINDEYNPQYPCKKITG